MNCELKKGAAARNRSSLVIGLFLFALLAATFPQMAAAKSKSVKITEHCQKIAQSDPRFRPLSGVCEFALSQSNLPNLVCQETVQIFASDARHTHWRKLYTVEAEVTFEDGIGDQYAKVKVNNQPVHGLSGRYTPWEVAVFLEQRLRRAPLDLAHFGGELLTVFTPSSKASFQYKDEVTISGEQLLVFDFQVKKKNNSIYWLSQGELFYPGFTGLLWVDENTSLLRRMVLHATELDPKNPIDAVASSTDYHLVTIPDLGQLLLPTTGESITCMGRKNQCWRNVMTFENCHKYAGKSRILPPD